MAYVPNSGSVIAFQGTVPWSVLGNNSVSGTVNVGNFPTNQNVSGSVIAFQGTTPFIITGSVQASVTPAANQSVSGTVGASIIGLAPVNVTNTVTVVSSLAGGIFPISGSVAAVVTNFPTSQNVSGSVVAFQGAAPWVNTNVGSIITVNQGSIATVIIGGSIAASFTPPANQSVSGTVQVDVRSSVAVVIIGGSILTSSTANQSVSGTVGASIIGAPPYNLAYVGGSSVATASIASLGIQKVGIVDSFGQSMSAFPATFLRTTDEPHQLFYDAFDTAIDVTNRWTSTTGSSGVAAANSAGVMTMGTGTVISGFSKLASQPTFTLSIPAWLGVSDAIALPDGAAPTVNAYRYWGTGTTPGSPSVATPVTDGYGFELNTDGKLRAVVYAGGTRTVIQDLSSSGNNTQPLDTAYHRYIIYIRTDKAYWYIDGITSNQLVATSNFQSSQVQMLPRLFLCVGNTIAPLTNTQIQCTGATAWDTGKNNFQISDGILPYRKATIKSSVTSAVTTDTALVTALHPSTPLPAGSNFIGNVSVVGTVIMTGSVQAAVAGSVVAFQGGAWTTSIVAANPLPIAGSVAAVVTNLQGASVSGTVLVNNGSVVAFQGTSPWIVNFQNSSILAVPTGSVITVLQTSSLFAIQQGVNSASVLSINPSSLLVGNYAQRNDNTSSFLGGNLTWNPLSTDSAGRAIVKPFSSEDGTIISYIGSVVSGSVQLIQPSVIGKRSYVTDFWLGNTGATTTIVTFQGGDTSILGKFIAPTAGGMSSPGIAIPIKTTLSQDLTFTVTPSTSVLYLTLKGYQAP